MNIAKEVEKGFTCEGIRAETEGGTTGCEAHSSRCMD